MGKKQEEIRKAIREMMQDNVMSLVASGKGNDPERYRQSRNLFLYLEIKDTSPRIRYLYDLSGTVHLGRSEAESQICIRDRIVSRYQGRIWAENGRAYYANEKDAGNPVSVRRGLWPIKIRPGERICLRTGDCLIVGSVKMKFRLFAGEQEI